MPHRRPTLRQLSYFLTSVERGSFAAAAQSLHLSQPSLSEQIRRLEDEVGGRLFVRTNRNLLLTDLGRQLVPLAETTLRSADTLVERLRDVRSLAGGTVSFGTFSSAHLYLLRGVTSEFRLRHPAVRIRVVGLNSSAVADMVRHGEIEAGLVQLPVDDHGLDISAPVLIDSVVYATIDARRASRPVTVADLAVAPLILSEARWGEQDPLRRNLAERARAAGVTIEPIVEVELQTAALELAAAGVGDTLVSFLVSRLPRYRDLVRWVRLEPVLEERFALVTRSDGHLSPATRAFVDLARRHISALQSRADAGRTM